MSKQETCGDRMRKFRDYMGYTQEKMGDILNKPQTSYNAYETRNIKPKQETLQGLSEMGLNLEWYFTGRGDMLKGPELVNKMTPQDQKEFRVSEFDAGYSNLRVLRGGLFDELPNGTKFFKVKDTAMADSLVMGDYVTLNEAKTPLPGDIVIVRDRHNHYQARRLKSRANENVIGADNHTVVEDAKDYQIVGVAEWQFKLNSL